MQQVIYIKLLEEGTIVYRPVLSFHMSPTVYKIGGATIYNPKNEKWEFLPDTVVQVEEKYLDGDKVLVAIRAVKEA